MWDLRVAAPCDMIGLVHWLAVAENGTAAPHRVASSMRQLFAAVALHGTPLTSRNWGVTDLRPGS